MSARRIFWGRSLQQAIAKAARHHRVDPDALAWKPYEKRHGFVKHPRAALVEVDPEAPTRPTESGRATESEGPAAVEPTRATAPTEPSRPARTARPTGSAPAAGTSDPPRKIVAQRNEPSFDAPDEDALNAAVEGARRILRFLAIDAEPVASRDGDRLAIELRGEKSALAGVTLALLDEIEHLLAKAIVTLAGRRVRLKVDCAGLRGAREAELENSARAAALRVVELGEPVDLGPLPAADRRVVHLAFADDPQVATESIGDGALKRVRLVPRASS